jgi:hydroxypyruvate reductase
MAKAAEEVLDGTDSQGCDGASGHLDGGIVITKYGHVRGDIPGVECFEAGHPVPDGNSFAATAKALELVRGLTADDTVVFLLSGGGSALFELPKIPGEELQDITRQLLASGADIVEMNTIRKRLSNVKGGRFALACEPAKVLSIVLSDVLGDPLDMIASGPAYPDASTCEEALAIAEKYRLKLSGKALELLKEETPKELRNVETHVNGSVRELCRAAAKAAEKLGYEPVFLTDKLSCEARDAGRMLAEKIRERAGGMDRDTSPEKDRPTGGGSVAFIAGGETVVHLTGNGLGGRNQEIALAAAPLIACIDGAAVFSVGSDGTDGPTDAAGGYVDCDSLKELEAAGLSVSDVLGNNDAYNALKAIDGLIFTGPTGTNVNDVSVALLRLPNNAKTI